MLKNVFTACWLLSFSTLPNACELTMQAQHFGQEKLAAAWQKLVSTGLQQQLAQKYF